MFLKFKSSDSDNIVITKADIEKYNDNHQLLLTFFKKELISNTFSDYFIRNNPAF